MIPDEAIDAAYDASIRLDITTSDIERILEAAAPHMLAQTLEDMAEVILTNDPLDFWSQHLPEGLGFQEAMSRWLKAHAAARRIGQ